MKFVVPHAVNGVDINVQPLCIVWYSFVKSVHVFANSAVCHVP